MPIVLDCPCGKQLRVPENSAGRRARCPACGRVQRVPGEKAAASLQAAGAARGPSPGASESATLDFPAPPAGPQPSTHQARRGANTPSLAGPSEAPTLDTTG